MNSKPVAVVDVDDTLFDCITNVLSIFNEATGKQLTSLPSRNLEKVYNLTRKEVNHIFNTMKHYMDNMAVYKHAAEFIHELSKEYDVHICTARGFIDDKQYAFDVTFNQLFEAGITFSRLHVMDTSCKLTYFESIGLEPELIVEDCPIQIENAQRKNIKAITSSQHYNEHLSTPRIDLRKSPHIMGTVLSF